MTRVTTIAVALVVLACVGCSGDDDDVAIPQGTSTSTTAQDTTTSTTPTDETDEEDVTARYEAFWDARFAANEDPVNPDSTELREYATGAQLEHVIEETTKNRDEGVAFRRPADSVYERRVTVISVEGDTAHLHDCVTNDGIVYRVASGEIIDDSVGTNSLDVIMRRVDGAWKLESAKLLQRWDGVSGCALAE